MKIEDVRVGQILKCNTKSLSDLVVLVTNVSCRVFYARTIRADISGYFPICSAKYEFNPACFSAAYVKVK
jgi:hypothetical protein